MTDLSRKCEYYSLIKILLTFNTQILFRPEKQNFKTACIHNKEKATSEDMNDLVQVRYTYL